MSATLDSKTIFWLNWLGLIWMITFFSGSLAMYSKHVYIYIHIFLSESSQKGTGKESFAEILDSVRSNLWKELPEFCEGHGSGEKKDETVVLLCIGLIWWWFQIFFIFTPTWGRFPIWLIFFKWVETTNRMILADFWGISGISHFFLFAQYIYIYWHIIDNSSKFHRHVFKSVFSRLVRYWVVMFVKFRSCFQQPQFLFGNCHNVFGVLENSPPTWIIDETPCDLWRWGYLHLKKWGEATVITSFFSHCSYVLGSKLALFHVIGDGHQPNSRGLYTYYKDSLLKVRWPSPI